MGRGINGSISFNFRVIMLAFCQFIRQLRTISNAKLHPESRTLQLDWDAEASKDVTPQKSRDTSSYPAVWLRDNCRCPKCYGETAKQRLVLMADLDTQIFPKDVKLESCQSKVTVTWPDDHVSTFDAEWLYNRTFSELPTDESAVEWLKPKLWASELQDKIPTEDYKEVLGDENALLRWLTALEEYGLALIKNAPKDTEVLNNIGQRVANLRITNYGKTFDVKVKDDPSNLAFTSARLGLHTDLPYYYYTPGVQMLHCLIQTADPEGGQNEFVDGFKVANDIKSENPNDFQTLITVPSAYWDLGTDHYEAFLRVLKPVIELNNFGDPEKIRYNDGARDSRLSIPLSQVQSLYDAIKTMNSTMYRPSNFVTAKLEVGDVVAFNNQRVLHGRAAYKSMPGADRHLMGGYLDWDEIRSRRRLLQNVQSMYY